MKEALLGVGACSLLFALAIAVIVWRWHNIDDWFA